MTVLSFVLSTEQHTSEKRKTYDKQKQGIENMEQISGIAEQIHASESREEILCRKNGKNIQIFPLIRCDDVKTADDMLKKKKASSEGGAQPITLTENRCRKNDDTA